MAIYHFSGTIISRSQGRSAVAASAYRAGEKILDERLNQVFDYRAKKDIAYREILLPKNATVEYKDRKTLWNAVETIEKRKDAQLAREFTLSLPRELSIERNIALIKEFVSTAFVAKGMIADICFHNDLMPSQERQPHAHVMLSLREVSKDGFGQKNRAWNNKENLLSWRELWASSVNHHLALNGHDQQIDHRSYKEQRIALEPQHKIGPVVAQERLARFSDHQRIARENGAIIFENPEVALDALTRQQSTFTHQELARFINRHTENAEQFQRVYEKVKASPHIVSLGLDAKRTQRFSTQNMLTIESSMMQSALTLHKRLKHAVKEQAKQQATHSRTLSYEQETAFEYLTEAGDLKSLVGFAGTGKSYLLGATKDAWEKSGYRVSGVALSGVAARNLAESSGIESRTIASFNYRLDRGQDALTANDVLVVDEAGMLGSRAMERLVRETRAAGAKLVLVGDWQQLQAIEAGAPFRALAEAYQYTELTRIRRQTIPWQVEASFDLALGHAEKALAAYREHHHIHTFSDQNEAKARLIDCWNDARISNPLETHIVLAYTRNDVRELNELARSQRRRDGELGRDFLVDCERGARYFAVNDRISFLKRDNNLGVINGTLGTIRSFDAKTGLISVELDDEQSSAERRLVVVNPVHYNHLEHGYAATVYKAQGVTVDRTYLLTSVHYDAHSTYVALTRHRQSCDVFVSRESFANDRTLSHTLARNRAKDITLDYTTMETEFARQRAIYAEKTPLTRGRPNANPDIDIETVQLSVERIKDQKFKTQMNAFEKEFIQKNPEVAAQITTDLNVQEHKRTAALKAQAVSKEREKKQQRSQGFEL